MDVNIVNTPLLQKVKLKYFEKKRGGTRNRGGRGGGKKILELAPIAEDLDWLPSDAEQVELFTGEELGKNKRGGRGGRGGKNEERTPKKSDKCCAEVLMRPKTGLYKNTRKSRSKGLL